MNSQDASQAAQGNTSLHSAPSAIPTHLSDLGTSPERLERVHALIARYRIHIDKAEKALREAFDMDPMYAGSLLRAAPADAALLTVPDDAPSNQTPYPVWSPYHPNHVPLTPEQALRPYDHSNPDESGLVGLDPGLATYYGVADMLNNLRQGRSVLKKTMAAVAPAVELTPAIDGPKPWKEPR